MDQQQKLHRRDLQLSFASKGGTVGTTSIDGTIEDTGGHSEKRKHRVLECDSDEDDFAGFDEEDAADNENGN